MQIQESFIMGNNYRKSISFLAITLALCVGFFYLEKNMVSSNRKTGSLQIAPVANAVNSSESISILFVGDMMFDRYIRQMSEKNGYAFPFQKKESILKGNDLVVGNLEGPMTDNGSISVTSKMGERDNYVFTFDPKVAQTLKDEGIRLVNIGNNHITNFGDSGIESTRKYLSQANVEFFGDPENEKGRMAVEKIKSLKIAFVNYNQFVSGAQQKTLSDINKSKNLGADVVIVYTHWGKEFVSEPDGDIKNLAHEFIDAGADLIIGSHPHVEQTKEVYKGKTIYYSLGNFIFDQYFSPETQKGMAVRIDIDPQTKNISFKEFQVMMQNNGQTKVLQ
ncbi:MAG TPA: CapA family protein [Patescibacteria group bacterium]